MEGEEGERREERRGRGGRRGGGGRGSAFTQITFQELFLGGSARPSDRSETGRGQKDRNETMENVTRNDRR